MNICIIGVGYVGLVTGTCLADFGHNLICHDIDETKISSLKAGKVPFFEPELSNLIKKNLQSKTIEFTTDLKYSIQNSDLIMICIGTPSNQNGEADISQIEDVSKKIGSLINDYKVIAIKSTVPVGTNRKVEKIIRENLINPVDFDVVSNPEFLREGTAIYDMFNSHRIIIGSNSKRAEKVIKDMYLPFDKPIYITTRESAELIKYASNCFLATKISYINEIANFCEKVGANILEVAEGMRLDPRIGSMFLNAGIGFGGSCFPKDLKALLSFGKEIGYDFKIIEKTLEVNELQKILPIHKLESILGSLNNRTICLWGLSFKPYTDDIRESPALDIIDTLLEKGAKIKTYDPLSMNNVKKLYPQLKYEDDCYKSAESADGIIVATEHEEFKNIDFIKIKSLAHLPIIVDGRNMLDCLYLRSIGFEYFGIGH
ncbi:MAG: UDP-glucose dehydrogenase family protein [Ignavibacteriales bacterium]